MCINSKLVRLREKIAEETGAECALFNNAAGERIAAYWKDRNGHWRQQSLRYSGSPPNIPHKDDVNLLIVTIKLTV